MGNYNFGNYLCELREKKGLTQSQLGERLGVTNKAISRWENGGAYPSSELMLPLAKELGVSIEELYSAMSESKTEKTKARRLIDALAAKSWIIISVEALLFASAWTLFLIFGNTPDKVVLLILSIFVTAVTFGFVRLLLFIFIKNPMVPSKYIDFISLFFITVSIIVTVAFTVDFIKYFPNGFYLGTGALLGMISAVLLANKKRI